MADVRKRIEIVDEPSFTAQKRLVLEAGERPSDPVPGLRAHAHAGTPAATVRPRPQPASSASRSPAPRASATRRPAAKASPAPTGLALSTGSSLAASTR